MKNEIPTRFGQSSIYSFKENDPQAHTPNFALGPSLYSSKNSENNYYKKEDSP